MPTRVPDFGLGGGDADQSGSARVVAHGNKIAAPPGAGQQAVYAHHQQHRAAVVHGEAADQGNGREILEALGQVFHPRASRVYVHHAPEHTVGAQGKNQRGDFHNGHAPAVDQADDRADEDAHCEGKCPVGSISQETAYHGCHKSQIGTHGHVDLPDEDGERHAHGDQGIHHGGVEAGADAGSGEKGGINQTNN